MAIPFPDNINLGVGNPIDAKYLNSSNAPYVSLAAVKSAIVESQRYVGLTVLVVTGGTNSEYWFKQGVTDGDLVLKTASNSGTITGATNLGSGNGTIFTSVSGNKIQLKTLSGGTNVTLTCNGDYIAINSSTSSPVTGATNGLSQSGGNVVLGGPLTGDTFISLQSNKFIMVNGTPSTMFEVNAPDDCVLLNTELAVGMCVDGTNNEIGIHTSYSAYGNNTISLITRNTASTLKLVGGTAYLTGTTVNLGGAVMLQTTPNTGSSSDDILVRDAGTGEVKMVSGGAVLTSAITGATNGLTKVGQNVILGGTLSGDTSFSGGFLKYATSPVFTSGTQIVDKAYVDTFASGLTPKAAVVVATTGNTVLSGLTVIDGHLLSNGERVLVKNQTSGQTNGVYIASASTWTRAADMNSSGNTVTGSYTWVLSGDTNANTAWVLTTPSPINIGVDVLTFVFFNNTLDVIGSNGITVTTSGDTNLVTLGGALTCDTFINGGAFYNLCQFSKCADIVAQCQLSMTSVFDMFWCIGTSTCPVQSIICDFRTTKCGIRYDDNYRAGFGSFSLVDKGYVDNKIGSVTSGVTTIAVTGATNGLCKYNAHNVCLGGILDNNTTIDLNDKSVTFINGACTCGSYLLLDSINCVTQLMYYNTIIPSYSKFCASENCSIISSVNNCGTASVYAVADNTTIYAYLCAVSGATRSSIVETVSDQILMAISDSACGDSSITIVPTGITVYGNYVGFAGVEYLSDYSANYTNRSLVDKEYVDNAVSGATSGSTTLTNGILKWSGNTFNPYSTATVGKLYSGTTKPTSRTTNLKYNGNFNSTNLFASGSTTQLGNCAGASSTSTVCQTVVGFCTGINNSAVCQTAIGICAGVNNSGTVQIAIGGLAGCGNTGNIQLAIGNGAGYGNTGACQIAIGINAGQSNKSNNQYAFGTDAGNGNKLNSPFQLALGHQAGMNNSGCTQIAIGYSAGLNNNSCCQLAIGFTAGCANSGSTQIAIGCLAGGSNRGVCQVAIGLSAGIVNRGAHQVAIGSYAGFCNLPDNQVAIGCLAGYCNKCYQQVAIGNRTGVCNSGAYQTALGFCAGQFNSGGTQVAIGQTVGVCNKCVQIVIGSGSAGCLNKGNYQIAIGDSTALFNSGDTQTAIGKNAGCSNKGPSQVAIGENAGYLNCCSNQVAIGCYAGQSNAGVNQVAIGCQAGWQNTGLNQLALGGAAGYTNIGIQQIALGCFSGFFNSGSTQIAIGFCAGCRNKGTKQVAIGSASGAGNCGNDQISIGNLAGCLNKGASQIAIGCFSASNNSGSTQIAIGISAGGFNRCNDQIAIGNVAGYCNVGACQIAIGYWAGRGACSNNCQIAIGVRAGFCSTGSTQVAIGNSAGECSKCNDQIAIGNLAGFGNRSEEQIAIGSTAGYNNTADCQVAIGNQAGQCNIGIYQVAIGDRAGQLNSGSTTISIGSNAGICNKGINLIAIGRLAGCKNTQDNKFILAQCHLNSRPLIYGDFSTGNVEMKCLTLTALTGATSSEVSVNAAGKLTRGVTGGTLIKTVCNLSVSTYSIKQTDFYIGTSGGSTITLLPNVNGAAVNGMVVTVADVAGNASPACYVQISGAFFGGGATACIDTAFGAISFLYNGGKSCWGAIAFSQSLVV